MINLCIDWKKVEVSLMGETITAEVRPPSPSHMLVISPHINFDREKMSDADATCKIYEMQKDVCPILPEVIRNIEGVQVNGQPITPQMLGAEASLAPLAVSLISHVMTAANLDKESEKNLPLPPAGKSPGQIAAE